MLFMLFSLSDLWKFSFLQFIPTRRQRLGAKFRLDRFILSPSGGEKHQILPFLDFGVLWCRQLV